MGYAIMFRSGREVEDYNAAGKKAKNGISMVMDGLDKNDMRMVMEGAEKAWDGVKTMCDISSEMEDRYSERRSNEGKGYSGGYAMREHEWNGRDDEMMERRMRDSRGRYM